MRADALVASSRAAGRPLASSARRARRPRASSRVVARSAKDLAPPPSRAKNAPLEPPAATEYRKLRAEKMAAEKTLEKLQPAIAKEKKAMDAHDAKLASEALAKREAEQAVVLQLVPLPRCDSAQ